MQDAVPEGQVYRAIVADDHAIVRAGLRVALETPELVSGRLIEVVAEAGDGLTAIAAVRQHQPDLLLLDVQMPLAGGVEVLVEVRRWSPDTRIVVFTGISAIGKIGDLVDAGVDGLFSKSAADGEIYSRIAAILGGERFIAPIFSGALELQGGQQQSLTLRERQVLNLIVAGRQNKEVAAILGISIKTVDRHRSTLMQKLGVHSLAQLIAYALRHELIDASLEL